MADARPQLDQLARYPRLRGVRQQLHWHDNPLYRFAARADLCRDANVQRNVARPRRLCSRLRPPGLCAADGGRLRAGRRRAAHDARAAARRDARGPLGARQGRVARRHARARRPAQRRRKLSGFGTFIHRNDPAHVAWLVSETVALFGADRCLFGSNFPIEKLWTDYAIAARRASRTRRAGCPPPNARRFSTRRRAGFTGSEGGDEWLSKSRYSTMATSSSNSSFLVLGRDCGRVRRVPTYGFLILGGPWPVVVDTGYRDNAIMETLGMRGPVSSTRTMIENQLARHGVQPRRRALHPAHAPAHRPCGQGRPFPDEHDGGHQPPRDGVLGLGPDAPAISQARHHAPGRAPAHAGRHAATRIWRSRGPSSCSPASSWRPRAPTPRAR